MHCFMDSSKVSVKSKKKKRKKNNKIYVTLTNRDQLLLARFCKINNVSKSIVLKKVIHEFLQEKMNHEFGQQPDNQLGLFEPVQMDIFDVIRK